MLTESSRFRLRPGSSGGSVGIGLLWWLPMLLVGVYVVVIATNLGTIVDLTWWSADSASAGVIGVLYHLPPPGQYIVIGDHGWFEEALFYILTQHLPFARAIAYAAPVFFWVVTIGLMAASAGRAYGRYGAALVAAGLLCASPAGLMVIFQPSAHTNSLLHAAVLSLVAVWVLPRIRELSLMRLIVVGVLLGLFTGLAVAGDTISLVWGPVPFVVVIVLAAWRGEQAAVARTLVFGAVTLVAIAVSSAVLMAVVHGLRLATDQLALEATVRFTSPTAVLTNFTMALDYLAFLMGGDFYSHAFNFAGELYLLIGLLVYAALGAVLFAARRAVAGAGPRPEGGGGSTVDARFVHACFWLTALLVGVVMFVLGSPAPGVSRYLVGPAAAIVALLPLAAARGSGWRISTAAGLGIVALAATISVLQAPSIAPFRATQPLRASVVRDVKAFAARWDASKGYASYWDAMTLTWKTGFGVRLYEIGLCRPFHLRYCARYQVSFTDAYRPRAGIRTLFIADPAEQALLPDPRWGTPLAVRQFGRLTVYVYPYDIASRMVRDQHTLQTVITGKLPGDPGIVKKRT